MTSTNSFWRTSDIRYVACFLSGVLATLIVWPMGQPLAGLVAATATVCAAFVLDVRHRRRRDASPRP